MNFEKIEQAYTYLLENTQSIQNELSTNFYDALIEQNAMYLDGKTDLDIVKNNSKKLKELGLSKEEWRRAYQFLFMKATQTEPLQAKSPVHTRCDWFYHYIFDRSVGQRRPNWMS